jgi:hypothetical protein
VTDKRLKTINEISVPTSKKTHSTSTINADRLVLFRKTSVFFEPETKQEHTMRQNVAVRVTRDGTNVHHFALNG